MTKKVDPKSSRMQRPHYPIDARATFKQSTTETMAQLVEKLEPVETALTAEQLQAAQLQRPDHHQGGRRTTPRLIFVPAFLDLNCIIDGGRSPFRSRWMARPAGCWDEASDVADSGITTSSGCSGGSDALAEANAKAIRGSCSIGLAEHFTNAPKLRANSVAVPSGPAWGSSSRGATQ